METIIRPIITEKTMKLADELNQYTFLVNPTATKITVAKSVAAKFDVKVENVRIINKLGRKVVFGKKRNTGKKSDHKKAIVTLESGQSIDIFKLK